MKENGPKKLNNTQISRRTLLKGAVAAGAAGLVGCAPEVAAPGITPGAETTLTPAATLEHTLAPSATLEPTLIPVSPTTRPTQTPKPTETPTHTPTPESTKTPEPSKTPEKPPVNELTILHDKLANEIEGFHGRNAISITNILTGESIDVNGERPQLPGCVANLPLALAAVHEIFNMDSPLKSADIEPHLFSMVKNSNPHEGVEVVRQLGGGDISKGIQMVNDFMKKWGMKDSFYDHPPAYPGEYSMAEKSNKIVPDEMNQVLATLAAGTLLQTENAMKYALRMMRNNKPGLNFMIPGQIPDSEATVYHKVGWFYGRPNTINDAGIVVSDDGKFMFSIVVMHEGDEHIDEQTLFQDAGMFLSKLSKTVYDYFKSKYA